MKVAVLGCGPAGLMAAQAVTEADEHLTIISQPNKSNIHGAQYVHKPIPGLHDPEWPHGQVEFKKVGDPRSYAQKVYGDPDAPVSWGIWDHGEQVDAWMMEETYETLWTLYRERIVSMALTPWALDHHVLPNYDLVISAIPHFALCRNKAEHKYDSANVSFKSADSVNDFNVILYNGDENDEWYRYSDLFGHAWYEYPGTAADADWVGVKPTKTTCTCYDDSVRRVGRFGKWDKGQLVTDAYFDALKAIEVYA